MAITAWRASGQTADGQVLGGGQRDHLAADLGEALHPAVDRDPAVVG